MASGKGCTTHGDQSLGHGPRSRARRKKAFPVPGALLGRDLFKILEDAPFEVVNLFKITHFHECGGLFAADATGAEHRHFALYCWQGVPLCGSDLLALGFAWVQHAVKIHFVKRVMPYKWSKQRPLLLAEVGSGLGKRQKRASSAHQPQKGNGSPRWQGVG